jgi:tetratricopeptide (TPR) repeat protein
VERVDKAVRVLQMGDEATARAELNQALLERPGYSTAKMVLDQLDADPRTYLGEQSFRYVVREGDTLSMIARRYLGNPLKFIILARYNGIQNPSRLKVGQALRIPGEREPEPTPGATKPPAPAARPLAGSAAGGAGPEREETIGTAVNESKSHVDLLVKGYEEYSDTLIAEHRWEKARAILVRATELEPTDETLRAKLALVEERIEAARLFELGQSRMKQNKLEEAYRAFKDAQALDQENAKYQQALVNTRGELGRHYHQTALAFYRKQQLDEARAYWHKVLEVDPDNTLAPEYLARVSESLNASKGLEPQ